MDVLIFDDDTHAAGLLSSVISAAGYGAEKFYDGRQALDLIRRLRPRLVFLDIMMPGMDGLSILGALKKDPGISGTQVVVVSSKGYAEETRQAQALGAATFLKKPYDLPKVQGVLEQLLGAPVAPGAAAVRWQSAFKAMVWGSQSASAGPGGPRTSCVSLDFGDRLVILDAGTGLEGLVAARRPAPREAWLLLSHHHDDHVSGLKQLGALAASCPVKIAGPSDMARPLEAVVAQLAPGLDRSRVQLFTLSESSVQLWPDVSLNVLLTRHPGATLAYRVEHRGRALVYCPDNEVEVATDDRTPSDFAEKLGRFVRGASVLIHDARYSDEDYAANADQGHSSPALAAELAATEGVRRLVLFHLDARYSPQQKAALLREARRMAGEDLSPLPVDLAEPGLEIEV